MNARTERIKRRLEQELAPLYLEIHDESAGHAGHAGAAQSGGGHFFATIVSSSFEGLGLVARHRLVYQALGDLMKSDIHAFSMKLFAPTEYQQQGISR